MSTSGKRDYYEVLGVSKTSSSDEIRKAYKQLALANLVAKAQAVDQCIQCKRKGADQSVQDPRIAAPEHHKRHQRKHHGAQLRQQHE